MEESSMGASGRRFTKTHEWLTLDGDLATMGISEYAVEQLGDIVYLQLPDVGKELNQGDALGEIESVKAVSQLYAPIAGKVAEVNGEADSRPELVNESPLENGWIVKLNPRNPADLDALLTQEQYDQFLSEQG